MCREKVFLYLQICFGNVNLGAYKADTETSSLYSTLFTIYQSAPRIAKGELLRPPCQGYPWE